MNSESNPKKAFIWNMIGSVIYSGSSFLYLMIVSRIMGVKEAGFFSLCYATAQLLLSVGRYGMRTYQATDITVRFSFHEYCFSRLITCAAMIAGGIVYSTVCFSGSRIVIGSLIVIMKMIDAVEDVYHGNLQQIHNVEIMGKLLAARNLFSIIVFTIVLLVTHSLLITCEATVASSLILCLVMNQTVTRRLMRKMPGVRNDYRWEQIWHLLAICTPLFLGTFLSLLLYNIPKYAMSAVMAEEYQTYYSVLFMPSFAITLMCEFVFKPTITSIAELWWAGEIKKFGQYVLRIIMFILIASIAIVLAGHLIGRDLLEIIYAVDLEPYKLDFIILLIGGGIGAEVYMTYNILIAIRKGGCILPVYAVTAVITIIPARLMITRWGLQGACLNYLLSCSVLMILFGGIFIYHYLAAINDKSGKCK